MVAKSDPTLLLIENIFPNGKEEDKVDKSKSGSNSKDNKERVFVVHGPEIFSVTSPGFFFIQLTFVPSEDVVASPARPKELKHHIPFTNHFVDSCILRCCNAKVNRILPVLDAFAPSFPQHRLFVAFGKK